MCLHPNASKDECHGPIVQAHTVQEQLLRRIARDGQVYGFPIDFAAIVSSRGVPQPRLLGVGQASTFSGFCAKHDDGLFSEIEKNAIQATPRHATLLAFRAICRELYAKEAGVLGEPYRRELDRGRDLPSQIAIQTANTRFMAGFSAGLKDIREQKRRYDRMLADCDCSESRYCVIWLDGPPDIMCSACTNPDWDFNGDRIQDLYDLSTPAQDTVLSLLASEGRGCAFFSWLAHEERACAKLVHSLLELGREQITHAIVRLVLSSFENQFWRPDWWEALAQDKQDVLIQRFIDTVYPGLPIPSDYLSDDRLRVVNWRIAGIETNDESLATIARRLNAQT